MPTSATDGSLFDRVCRDPKTGQVAIAQVPNAPLIVFVVSSALRLVPHPHGTVNDALSIVGSLSLAVWALLEVARGDSLFRRILGAVVLLGMAVGPLLH